MLVSSSLSRASVPASTRIIALEKVQKSIGWSVRVQSLVQIRLFIVIIYMRSVFLKIDRLECEGTSLGTNKIVYCHMYMRSVFSKSKWPECQGATLGTIEI